MENNTIIKVAALGVIGLILTPVVVDVAIKTKVSIGRGIKKLKHNIEIRKGVKDGSLVVLDDDHYEIVDGDVEEA